MDRDRSHHADIGHDGVRESFEVNWDTLQQQWTADVTRAHSSILEETPLKDEAIKAIEKLPSSTTTTAD